MDFVANIYNNNELVITIAGGCLALDSDYWYEISDLCDYLKEHNTKEDILEYIKDTRLYDYTREDGLPFLGDATEIHIDKELIVSDYYTELYDLGYDFEGYGMEFYKRDDSYYTKYDTDDEEYEVPKIAVELDKLSLLNRRLYSFDDTKKLTKFMDQLIALNDNVILVNGKYIIKLNVN